MDLTSNIIRERALKLRTGFQCGLEDYGGSGFLKRAC